jgi:Fe-S-cluster containining protein
VVNLTSLERRSLGPICIATRCQHLGNKGCTLEKNKPFGCDLYPLAYDPEGKRFYFDRECPLLPTYMRELDVSGSDASRHLARMQAAIRRLEKTDLNYLRANFEFDRDYFDLEPLNRTPD